MKPLLAMVYMKDCGACEATKPHFEQFAQQHPQTFQFARIDIDKAKLDFPVEYTPTFVLKLPRGVYKTDPVSLGKDITSESLGEWVRSCARDYKMRGL